MWQRHRQRASLGILAIAVAVVLAIIPLMTAQNAPPAPLPPLEPIVSQAVGFAVTGPASEMSALDQAADQEAGGIRREIPIHDVRPEILNDPGTVDTAQQTAPVVSSAFVPPSLSFDGLSSQDNVNLLGALLSPPDTNGAVGPNHYVQMTNLLWRVWSKNGNPLTAPLRLSTLFLPLGPPCSLAAKGDPVVRYDSLADRWLISQFGFVTSTSAPYFECIAISQTPDPTGAYFLYAFQTQGNEFPDYPKIGVWPDAYYMTVNQFTNNGPFNGTGAYAFDRGKMLAGDPAASYIYFNLNLASHPEAIVGMLPSDFDGLIAPPAGRPNTFAYFTSLAFGNASDALRLFDFHADFANPANSTFKERSESPVAVAAFNPTNPAGRADIQQVGTTVGLDAIGDRLLFRLQYRNFGMTESLVANHTVGAPASTVFGTYRAGVRYYQLTSGGGPFTIAEQATYAPADGLSRWMGSAATDNQGNLAVGFATSSTTTFPSIAYAGRLASDTPGGLFQGENTLVAGTGVQTGSNRWGDYSALTVDPSDDCTFWYTNEYYTAASQASNPVGVGWLTRIGRFKFPSCTPPAQGTLQGLISDASGGAPISGALIRISGGFSANSISSGSFTRILAPGTYDVTVSRLGYLPVTRTGVFISNGNTTTLNVALTGTPVMAAGNTAVTAESFFPANGAIDAGETVTLNFGLNNIGGGATTDLVATLLPTGGVLTPSGPQHYGAIGAGSSGVQAFSFRADALLGCGGKLTATMHLQDGGNDLGNVSFNFVLAGNLITVFEENFDGVPDPLLPAGWVASNPDASPVFWVTSAVPASAVDTQPNRAFVSPPEVVTDKRLDSPAFLIRTATAQLSFRHGHTFQTAQDGGVLEISIDGGPFTDILSAGGSFVTGGYTNLMTPGSGNPLAGRAAWSGTVGLRTTTVNLPAAAAGKFVKLRWRMGSDTSVASPAGTGWSVDTIAVTELLSVCTYNIVADASAITAESFLPAQGAIDAGETVTVNLTLRNTGTASTTALVATLLSTDGVLDPGAPQNYGAILPGATGTRPFTLRADPLLGCGGVLTATLQLKEGAVDLGTVAFKFLLAGNRLTILTESFDDVIPPLLPAGWVATKTDASPTLWITQAAAGALVDTPPNTAIINAPEPFGDKRLDSPAFLVKTAAAQLTFRHFNATQTGFDGGVLEISVDGGAFTDILAAGGSFILNGYDGVISTTTGSPIAGRSAWTVSQGGFRTTTVNLPAAAAGKLVKIRWRFGADNSVTSAGWRVDTVSVTELVFPCNYNILAAGAAITTESFAPKNGVIDPGENVSVNFTLANAGTQGTTNLLAKLLSTGGVTSPSSPQTYGAVAGNGGTGTKSFSFRADPALICSSPLVATHQIFENGVDLGIIKFNFVLGPSQTAFSENFDSVIPTVLPPGWAASSVDASPAIQWITQTSTPDTPPNYAFVSAAVAAVLDKRLDSPSFLVQSATAQLRFRHFNVLQPGFDGGVLEISIAGAPFTDILAAGGSFVEGGYDATISAPTSPLNGRQAWSSNQTAYRTTTVNLPAAAAGKNVKLRWRMGTDSTIASTGWRLDTITVTDNIPCAAKSNTTTSVTSNLNPSSFGQLVVFTAAVSAVNSGVGKPTGSVTFKDGASTLGTLPLNALGQASGSAALPAGSHTITAEYTGDGDFNASVSPPLTEVVNPSSAASLVGSISGKSGAANARVWTITLTNDGPGPANNTQITDFKLAQTFGPACTPVIVSPGAFPLSLGLIAPGASANGLVTINFTGCAASARFTTTIPFSANGGAVTGSIVRYNQFQ